MTQQDLPPHTRLEPETTPATVPPPQAPMTRGAEVAAADPAETRGRRELNRLRGFNLGAALFGWLIVVGIAALLSALLAAGGAAIGLTQTSVVQNGEGLSVAGAVLLGLVLVLAYYAGGYVAGRLSRFSGGLQGFGVWLIGVLVTAALGLIGVIAGSKYNVLSQLRLPSIPVNGQSLATGAVIALIAITVGTLLAAIAGGAMGLRYHHRVDRALEKI